MTERLSESSPGRQTAATGSGFTRYCLDERDRIVEIGGDWDHFARENGAEDLVAPSVIGMPLRRFIAGDVTRMFVDAMLARVRLTGRPALIPYRCDSPGIKRMMEMSLTSIGKGLVSEHRILSEQRMFSALAFAAAEGRADGWVRRCSMCNSLTDRHGNTFEPDAFPHATGETLRVIYHVCPECQQRVKVRLAG